MQDKTMIILEPTEYGSDERACLYLERSVFGVVSLLNIFNMAKNREYKLLLLDDDGGVITETVSENYKLFKLPKNFSLNSDMYAELYDGDRLVLSGRRELENSFVDYGRECGRDLSEVRYNDVAQKDAVNFLSREEVKPMTAKEWADETGQTELFNSATEILNKFRSGLFNLNVNEKASINSYEDITKCCDKNIENISIDEDENDNLKNVVRSTDENEIYTKSLTFWQSISDDFEEVFMSGKREQILEGLFKNSMWSRHISEDGAMCFGKIYKEDSHFYGATPDIVALAVPVISEKVNENVLGSFGSFIKANEYDDFGFVVLLQEAESGRAIKIIKNKG